MDGDITRGPMPRWQKKMNSSTATLNASTNNTSKISISYNSVLSNSMSAVASNKTPQKNLTSSVNFKGKKTPGKSPGMQFHHLAWYYSFFTFSLYFCPFSGRKTPNQTPNKSGSKTPNGAGGDRFIPNRASSNFDIGHYKVSLYCLYLFSVPIFFSISWLFFFFDCCSDKIAAKWWKWRQ